MRLAERLQALLDELPAGWSEAEIEVTIPDRSHEERAALVLASLQPGRFGNVFRVRVVRRHGTGVTREVVERALGRLDDERLDARLALARALTEAPEPGPALAPHRLAEAWDRLVATFPPDWSDAYLEIELASSDDLDRAALRLAPVNPFLAEEAGPRPVLRFRAARAFGYGAAPMMARRALERLDEEGIQATLRLRRLQSGVKPVLTQGPVWRESRRAV